MSKFSEGTQIIFDNGSGIQVIAVVKEHLEHNIYLIEDEDGKQRKVFGNNLMVVED